MKLNVIALSCAVFLAAGLSFSVVAGPNADSDEDGVSNGLDNCVDVANPTQCDTNLDGYGNICDPDIDTANPGVGVDDFNAFKSAYLTNPGDAAFNPNADFDCIGGVGVDDFNTFKAHYLKTAGPSGLICAGTTSCKGF